MKNIIRLTLIIIFSFQFFESKAQKLEQLIYENEELIYSFKTKNKKQIFIVKDKSNAYINCKFQ